MGFFDKLKDTVSVADFSQKISGTTTVLKLKNQKKMNEKEIDRLIFEAGRQLVSQHLDDNDSEYEEIFQEIKRLQEENLSILDELQRMKEEQERLQRMKEEQEKLRRMKEEQERLQRMKEEQLQKIKEEQDHLREQEQERVMQGPFKTCEKCGEKNGNSAKFCVYCGNPFTETSDNGEYQEIKQGESHE